MPLFIPNRLYGSHFRAQFRYLRSYDGSPPIRSPGYLDDRDRKNHVWKSPLAYGRKNRSRYRYLCDPVSHLMSNCHAQISVSFVCSVYNLLIHRPHMNYSSSSNLTRIEFACAVKFFTLRKLYDVLIYCLQGLSGIRYDTGFLDKIIHSQAVRRILRFRSSEAHGLVPQNNRRAVRSCIRR